MPRQVGKFTKDLVSFKKKVQAKGDIVLKNVSLEAWRILLRRSPVLYGPFRGNWRVAIGKNGAIGPLDLRATKDDKSQARNGQEATGEEMMVMLKALENVHFGDRVHITENLPYAIILERGYYSTKAPQGILKVGYLELKAKLPVLIESARLGVI